MWREERRVLHGPQTRALLGRVVGRVGSRVSASFSCRKPCFPFLSATSNYREQAGVCRLGVAWERSAERFMATPFALGVLAPKLNER